MSDNSPSTPSTPNSSQAPESPFHRGEQAVQSRLGVRESMERFGNRVIRDHMPEQHQKFYQQLPFIFVGHGDEQGWPWASILFGEPGFISTSQDKLLKINAKPVSGDPLADAIKPETKLGLLGIELHTRRRNRLAAHITGASGSVIELAVDQSFGNCPQYIQNRRLVTVSADDEPVTEIAQISTFDQQARELIAKSDTFFVASHFNKGGHDASEGADVSHRGGKPGFIRIDNEKTLTIPDYLGNNHFNTLGNFIENGKAGLLFVDFDSGHLLTVTGRVEILWDPEQAQHFEGAQRLWQFHIEKGRWLENGLPLRWQFQQYSPNTLLTGSWEEAEQLARAEREKAHWLAYTLVNVERESSVISSFYFAAKGHKASKFAPGQFLTIKAEINGVQQIRTYTLSSAPGDELYRISVKRETAKTPQHKNGVFSNFLHDQLNIGDELSAKAPLGAFTYDPLVQRPAVLLAAGIGITPMVSMARHTLIEGMRSRYTRELTLISAARCSNERAFFDELQQIAQQSNSKIRSFWSLSQINSSLKAGKDYHASGRISRELLQAVLPLADYDFYLCGPSGFMQGMYDIVRELGVRDARIYAEEFGPASLVRQHDAPSHNFHSLPAASEAIVEFAQANMEQAWTPQEGNLLEFAQAHGLTPEFGCRSGQCGACKTKLLSGKVVYQSDFSYPVEKNEVLLCCAMPAAEPGQEVVKLCLDL